MASSFEDAVRQEQQRQGDETSTLRAAADAKTATKARLVAEVLGAAREFRDLMVARNVPTQPLHVFVDYRDYSVSLDRRADRQTGTETVDSQHFGWRPLREHYTNATSDYREHSSVAGGLFVTTDAHVVLVGSVETTADIAARTPAVHTLLWPHPEEKPEWVLQGQPAPLEELQRASIDDAVLTGYYGVSPDETPHLMNEWGRARDDFIKSAVIRLALLGG